MNNFKEGFVEVEIVIDEVYLDDDDDDEVEIVIDEVYLR
jgi:hypothetical protein